MKRKGLGRGLGKGYKNIVPRDPYVHGLSAKGVKTYDVDIKKATILVRAKNPKEALTKAVNHLDNSKIAGKVTNPKLVKKSLAEDFKKYNIVINAKGRKVKFPEVETNDGTKLRIAYYLNEDDKVNNIKGGRLIISFTPEGRKGMYSYYVDTLMESYPETWQEGKALCVHGGIGTEVMNIKEIMDFTMKNRWDIENQLRGWKLKDKGKDILRAKGKKKKFRSQQEEDEYWDRIYEEEAVARETMPRDYPKPEY